MKDYSKFCVFIDVLGYKNIVENTSRTVDQRIQILVSIYENLAVSIAGIVNDLNALGKEQIFMKSFSDCFYFECEDAHILLTACNNIYTDVVSYYQSFIAGESYTPLIRGGMVKDWTVHFTDLSSFVGTRQQNNPVGQGVARAYLTSEKSKLSGMRLLVSEEVIEEIITIPIMCDGEEFLKCSGTHNGELQYEFFFHKVRENEEGKSINNLYDLVWTKTSLSSCATGLVEELVKIKDNFDADSLRHFHKTIELTLKGLLLTDCNPVWIAGQNEVLYRLLPQA